MKIRVVALCLIAVTFAARKMCVLIHEGLLEIRYNLVAVRMNTLLPATAGEASDIALRLFLPRSLYCGPA